MNRFSITPASIYDAKIIQRRLIGDNRGYLERLFCRDDLADVIGVRSIAQINHSFTEKIGTIRGLHYQHPPSAEMKLVSCVKGQVFDVAVDLRQGSPTFLQWHAEVLSEDNFKTLAIPEGFAHGFQTMTDDCELIYLHTAPYVPADEAGLNVLDPALSIEWPLPVTDISERDSRHGMISSDFQGLLV